MAATRIILRPNSTIEQSSSLTTTLSPPHLSVNEEVADDDSSYITGSSVGAVFGMSVPNLSNIIVTKIYCVMRCGSVTSGGVSSVNVSYQVGVDGAYTSETATTLTSPANGYVILRGEIDVATITAINNYISTNKVFPQLSLNLQLGAASGKDSVTTRVTQVYLDVRYTIGSYKKINNAWLGASKAYRKINGQWVELDIDECKTILSTHVCSSGTYFPPTNVTFTIERTGNGSSSSSYKVTINGVDYSASTVTSSVTIIAPYGSIASCYASYVYLDGTYINGAYNTTPYDHIATKDTHINIHSVYYTSMNSSSNYCNIFITDDY